jgi:hypothetical protein
MLYGKFYFGGKRKEIEIPRAFFVLSRRKFHIIKVVNYKFARSMSPGVGIKGIR